MAKIQIDEELFCELCKVHLLGISDSEAALKIYKGLNSKLEALNARAHYTQYKTAPTEEEQQEARSRYLELKCVPKSFRW